MTLLLAGAALAAPGLRLPEGEDPDGWAEATTLAGLSLGCGDDPCVEVVAAGGRWLLTVGGGSRQAQVPRPFTAAERAEVAWLAASLAAPLRPPVSAAPPAPVSAPSPVPSPPSSPVPRPSPRPTPGNAPAPLAPAPPPLARRADAATPAGARVEARLPPVVPSVRTEARVGAGAAGAVGRAPAGSVSAGVGVLRGPLGLDLGFGVTTPAALGAADGTVREQRIDLLLSTVWAPSAWLQLGPAVGGARRAWGAAGEPAGAAWTPTAGGRVQLSRAVALGRIWAGATTGVDLRPVRLEVDGADAGRLSPGWGRIELGLALGGPG